MGSTQRVESPAFTIEAGTVTRESGGSRTSLRFTAPAKRLVDGGFEVSNIRAVLYDKDGKFIARRSHESSRTVLGNRAAWVHEIPSAQLAQAARAVYEIEYRVDVRRKLLGGELVPLAIESDESDYWLWHRAVLADRFGSYELAFWTSQNELFITHGHTPSVAVDMFRNEYELDFLDADQMLVMSRSFSGSTMFNRTTFDDTSLYGIDRKSMRSLRFFEIRARTEMRSVVDLPVTEL
jgi:hypothetical protein